MFVAWRDLRFAKGRFALIGAVVALITLLVGFLSGLTAGLANQNISAITGLSADRIVLQTPAGDSSLSYSDSKLTAANAAEWATVPGVDSVNAIGISQLKITGPAGQSGMALFGATTGVGQQVPTDAGSVTLPEAVATTIGATTGDTVSMGGHDLTVAGVVDSQYYSHQAVGWVALPTWQQIAASMGNPDAYATALAVTGSDIDYTAADAATGTTSSGVLQSLLALDSFRSEIGSLLLMVVMLFGISALVVGAFFTVWSIQRSGDVAVLKALGASNRTLVRDALGQAGVILVIGVGIGIGLTAALGAAAGTALPFVLSPLTTLLPAAAMVVLGLAGAAFALRSVTAADPLTALGSNR